MDQYAATNNLNFGVLLGDMVIRNPTATDWAEVIADVERLEIPVHFAPGNHDLEDTALYREFMSWILMSILIRLEIGSQ